MSSEPRPILKRTGAGSDYSTYALAQTTRHRPELKRLYIGLGPLDSTSARARTRQRHLPERLDIDMGPNDYIEPNG